MAAYLVAPQLRNQLRFARRLASDFDTRYRCAKGPFVFFVRASVGVFESAARLAVDVSDFEPLIQNFTVTELDAQCPGGGL